MITLIILIALLVGSIFLFALADREDMIGLQLLSILMIVLFAFSLIAHLMTWPFASYNFNKFKVKRDAFENTLKNSRYSDNYIERAAIIDKVSDWNQSLAIQQYDNGIWFFDQYIDDRIDELKPIE